MTDSSNGNGSEIKSTRPQVPVYPDPMIDVPDQVLARYNARILDPTTATRVSGQQPIRRTVYVADRLIVGRGLQDDTNTALEEAAAHYGLRVVDAVEKTRATGVAAQLNRRIDRIPKVLRLEPAGTEATAAPDAWQVLQTFRALAKGPARTEVSHVGLDHLMQATRHTSGSPFVLHPGYDPNVPSASYAQPGWGGRQPVGWLGPDPERKARKTRRPVVAIVDTGFGEHPWLPSPEIVQDIPAVLDVPIKNPEITGVTMDPITGVLDSDAGHGTFIAGLVRQHCPDADICSIEVMGGDGWVAESNLLDVLWLLVQRQEQAIAAAGAASNDPSAVPPVVDVVVLSLGFYHEQPDDTAFGSNLLDVLQTLGRLGVAVVAAAGNDSTQRPMFPAAFTPWPHGPVTETRNDCLPIVSVGALNPNRTVAMFSNAGQWVICYRAGAAVVSTFPTTFNGSAQPSYVVRDDDDRIKRESIDGDDFRGGFGVWSGTSFAAPVLAGQLAAQLCDDPLTDLSAEAALERGWKALRTCVKRFAQ